MMKIVKDKLMSVQVSIFHALIGRTSFLFLPRSHLEPEIDDTDYYSSADESKPQKLLPTGARVVTPPLPALIGSCRI